MKNNLIFIMLVLVLLSGCSANHSFVPNMNADKICYDKTSEILKEQTLINKYLTENNCTDSSDAKGLCVIINDRFVENEFKLLTINCSEGS